MLIEIEKELFETVKEIIKKRNKTISKKLEDVQEVEKVNLDNSLKNARIIKTSRVKERIKNAMLDIKKEKLEITKYQVHKKTNIAYVTLAKYFDEILKVINK